VILINFQEWFDKPREFNSDEIMWINKLLSLEFPGRDIIREQLSNAKVNGRCTCGCLSVNTTIDKTAPYFPLLTTSPVEMIVSKNIEVPALFRFLVKNGYVYELEALRLDSV
jgi:hypothetical protein